MASYSGFSHEKWWFSIVMLVYQRLYIYIYSFFFFISHGCQDQVKLDLRDKQLLVEQLVPGHKKDCDFLFGEDSDILGIFILFLWDESNFQNFQLLLDWKNETCGYSNGSSNKHRGYLDYLERKSGGILGKKNWMESLVQHQQYPLLPAEFFGRDGYPTGSTGVRGRVQWIIYRCIYLSYLILSHLIYNVRPPIRQISWGSHHSNFTMVYGTYNYTQWLGRI